MIRRILVPVDGSTFCEQALPIAIGLANRCGASLELALAEDAASAVTAGMDAGTGGFAMSPYALPVEAMFKQARAESEAYLERLVRRVGAAVSDIEVRSHRLAGSASGALAEHARTNADVIVMSTHGRGGPTRLWLGSVSDRLVREVSIPVILVKRSESPAALDAPVRHRFAQVLVALDGSAFGEAVLEPVMEVLGADRDEVTITLLHVQPPIPLAQRAPSAADQVPGTWNGSAVVVDDYVEEVEQRLRAGGFRVESRIIAGEQISRAILETARELGADLIALATHGHGGIRRLLTGSVADEVVRGADTTVLTYQPVHEASLNHG